MRTGAIALKLMVLVIDVDDFLSRLLSRRPCGIGSKSNREMVGLTLENRAAESAGRNGEIANYSFNWLWTELGVLELRR